MSGWRGNNQVWEDEEENGDTVTCEERLTSKQRDERESKADLFNRPGQSKSSSKASEE